MPRVLRSGLGVILLSSVLFGLMAVAVRVAARSLSGPQVAFFRFAGSLVVLLAATRGRGLRPEAGNVGPLVLRGLIGAAAIVLYFTGIRGAGAGLATLLQNSYPVFASIFAALVLGEPFSGRLALALTVNLTGVAVVVGPDLRPDSPVNAGFTAGALAACCSAILSGAAVVAARHLRRSEDAALITTYFMAVGALVTAPSLLGALPAPSAGLALALLAVVLTSVAGQWLLHHGLGFTSAGAGSIVAATSVFTATTLEALVLGQVPSAHALAGGCFLIAAVGLTADRS